MKKIEDFLARELKYVWGKYKTIIILFFVLGPFLIQILFKVLNQIFENSHTDLKFYFPSDWLGFWGSYLGIIPSGLIAYAVSRYQIETEKDNKKIEAEQKNLPYLMFHIEQTFHCIKQDKVFQYRIPYFIKFSAYNNFYPIRSVTAFIYMNTDEDKEPGVKDSVYLGDIMPGIEEWTPVTFMFDENSDDFKFVELIFYGRLIDSRVVKIKARNNTVSHLFMDKDKVWHSYEPEPLEIVFNDLEKEEIREKQS